MIIGAYYIERSYRYSPCWTIANSEKEAVKKAIEWAKGSNCYVSVEFGNEQIALFDEKGIQIK